MSAIKFAIQELELAQLFERVQGQSLRDVLAEGLALAWHLRQRDGARALELAQRLEAEAASALSTSALARLALVRCEVQALWGHSAEAEESLAQAKRHLSSGTDPILEGDTHLVEALLAKCCGQAERQWRALHGAEAAFGQSSDFVRLGVVRAWSACERHLTHAGVGPAEASAPADCADPVSHAHLLAAQGLGHWQQQPAQAARAFLDSARQAQDTGQLRLACVSMLNAGNAYRVLGHFSTSAQCLVASLQIAKPAQWKGLVATIMTQLGAMMRQVGQLQASHHILADALLMLRGLPKSAAQASACSEIGQTLLEMARGPEAIAAIDEALDIHRSLKSALNLAPNLLRRAQAMIMLGNVAEASACMRDMQNMIGQEAHGALDLFVIEALAEAHQHAELPEPPGMQEPNAALHYGMLAWQRGQAMEDWRATASLLQRISEGWAAAGDWRKAHEFGRRASDELARMLNEVLAPPYALLVALAGNTLPEFGVPLPVPAAPQDSPQDLLSPRELDVLKLLSLNYTNKEIAKSLNISADTVKWHLKNLFGKLSAQSRRHAVYRARAAGLLYSQ